MKRIEIPDVETFIAGIQDEISHTAEGKYYHRLHVALHALKTHNFYESAKIYDHSPHSVYNWIHRLKTKGLAGLWEGRRSGRPRRLTLAQQKELRQHLLLSRREFGYHQNIWDGPLLSYHLEKHFSVCLKVRQCQNLFHNLGFTLQRPRRKPAKANPAEQEAFKKNSKNG
ncbi:MAG: winged helix-turn-helix domain-containing protein [bacterium]